jgi:prolyl-tRNA synthetase
MKSSQLFTRTSKQAPAEEVSKNAQLLIRAGYVYKVMAGVYAYTPLGLRVLENIKQIVREEMNAIGGQELIMSSLQRRETWEETGRWDDDVVDIWFKSKLKDGTDVGFGWSHEEAIIEMLKTFLSSYKDLPINVYQFQTKLRNELRAKSGIMRGREFVMKDMYSCSLGSEQHESIYQACIEAYKRVFDRIGVGESTYVTFASGGAFTQYSHEFQTLCEAGEDKIYRVPSTGEAFNEEIAPSKAPAVPIDDNEPKPLEYIDEPGVVGVEAIAARLGLEPNQTTKTMLYLADDEVAIAAVVRGDYAVNEDKLKAVLGVSKLRLADEETIQKQTGAESGYAGLLHLPAEVRVVIDEACEPMVNFETGANKTGQHAINVNWERDLPKPEAFYDIKTAKEGDIHPDTGEVYTIHKTAEVGNIFNFGIQKSKDTNFSFANDKGEQQYVHLGSYGIGITRLMGVLAENFSDENGLVWPDAVAPFRVYIARLGSEEQVVRAADELYNQLQSWGIEVLYDDTDRRPGEKFADADLLGIPHRIVVSAKTTEAGTYEYKKRTEQDSKFLSLEELKIELTK